MFCFALAVFATQTRVKQRLDPSFDPCLIDQGQGLSEHTAPFDALVCVLDGEAEIMISGNPYVLKMGEMIILPVNEPHSLKAVKKFKMMLTMIRS